MIRVGVQAGFRFGAKGAHMSRTMMLKELTMLLDFCPDGAEAEDYQEAIVNDNCLAKRTDVTRKKSAQYLRQLYGLDPELPLFRLLRFFWMNDRPGRPLLAMLLALGRDPMLRVTVDPIMSMDPGEELARQQLTDVLRDRVGDRLNDATIDKVVRNSASSWTQSGHLRGRSRKRRLRVEPTPMVMTYALLLGYILGSRGERLFATLWTRILDRSADVLKDLALEARRLSLLDMKSLGGVVELRFTSILTESERGMILGTD